MYVVEDDSLQETSNSSVVICQTVRLGDTVSNTSGNISSLKQGFLSTSSNT